MSRGSLDNPEVVEALKMPAGVISSSTQAELVVIELVIDWLWRHKENWVRATVATDSQATLATLKKTRKGKCEDR